MRKDVVAKLTASVLEAMENPDTRKQMRSTRGHGNAITGHKYRGLNKMITAHERMKRNFTSNRRLTMNQCIKAGAYVKEEERLLYTEIFFWNIMKVKDEKTGKEKIIPTPKIYRVYNLDQIRDEDKDKIKAEKVYENDVIPTGEEIIQQYLEREKISVEYGDPAYSPMFDRLYMPDLKDFKTNEEYYLAYFHEMTHSTGHKDRLKRLEEANTLKGSQEYSKEELVAEFGACLVFSETGLDFNMTNPANYLASRATRIKAEDKQAELFNAISKAEKACKFILNIKYEG